MTDSFTFHLNSPMTEDDWNKIRDVELEHTERIWYSTPSGRRVDFINANVLDKIRAEFKSKADGDDWYHTTDGLVWEEAMEIIDKHRKGENE